MGASPLLAMLASASAGAGAVDPADPNGWPRQPNGDPDIAKMTPEQSEAYLKSIGVAPTPAPSPTPTPAPGQPAIHLAVL